MKKSLLIIMSCLVIIVAGCTAQEKDQPSPENANLVASEKTLPSDFEHLAELQEPEGYIAVRVQNQKGFEAMWQKFQFEGEIPEIDLKENDLFFIGMFESSSCPYEIDTMNVEAVSKELTVNFSPLAEACTADLSPRNFVIEVPKEFSSDLDSILFVSQEQQTKVPIQLEEEILKMP
ncbi:hypothetical protein PGH26_07745 [Sporosarcina jeotgali]|uniref:PrcB C-terminal domain-containing protein n=1 Tax=Sporosarcina jeotgali TaxID=3020056 RepID=A0ABZ0L009_9BACL|nr:hypothetical protein [Sporosarcina sp. B2O-1]WOV85815.1 hypothetical protein PGH26_07745 [Sporosarcina sp. B2O-1]